MSWERDVERWYSAGRDGEARPTYLGLRPPKYATDAYEQGRKRFWVAEALEILRGLEWSSESPFLGGKVIKCCPICAGWKPFEGIPSDLESGHKTGCRLEEFLRVFGESPKNSGEN